MLRPVGFFFILIVCLLSVGCYSLGETQRQERSEVYAAVRDHSDFYADGVALVKFDVKPVSLDHVSLYLDESYYGNLGQWKEGVVKMPAGHRKIKLESPGFFPQRFDFDLAANSQSTFSITLEPLPEEVDPDDSKVRSAHSSLFLSDPFHPRENFSGNALIP